MLAVAFERRGTLKRKEVERREVGEMMMLRTHEEDTDTHTEILRGRQRTPQRSRDQLRQAFLIKPQILFPSRGINKKRSRSVTARTPRSPSPKEGQINLKSKAKNSKLTI